MPFKGGADVGGGHRRAAATACMEQQLVITADDTSRQLIPLRIVGQSRCSVVVTQVDGGVPGGFRVVLADRLSTTKGFYNTGFPYFSPYQAMGIGAIGTPETFEFHVAHRLVGVEIFGPIGATFDVVLYASGSS